VSRGDLGDDSVDQFGSHVLDRPGDIVVLEDLAPLAINDLALLVHHVVIFEEMLTDIEMVPLDLALGVLDRPADHAVLDRFILLHAQLVHDAGDPAGTEDPQQVVLEREIEARRAGIALASRAAAQLVVDAP